MLEREYREFSGAAGLKTHDQRALVVEFGPGEARRALAAEKSFLAVKQKAEDLAAVREKNLQFIRDDATIKAQSGLPKKLLGLPNEELKHTVNVNIDKSAKLPNGFHAVAPRGSELEKVEVMAGAGTSTPIRDLKRLYSIYGLSPEKWQKKAGTAYGEKYHYVIHWYEHDGVIPVDEIKLKGMKENK